MILWELCGCHRAQECKYNFPKAFHLSLAPTVNPFCDFSSPGALIMEQDQCLISCCSVGTQALLAAPAQFVNCL